MLLLSDVKDYLKALGIADNYYVGKLDAKTEKSVGVYQRGQQRFTAAVGKFKKYETKSVSILIHWTKNSKETEKQALLIYEKLISASQVKMGQKKIYCIIPQTNEPVDVGMDDTGVYERVIWLDLYYER